MIDRDRLKKLVNEAFIKSDDNFGMPSIKQVTDYLVANGVIALPCNVGDTLYYYSPDYGTILPYFVESINIRYLGDEGEHCIYTFETNCLHGDELMDSIDFELDEIGKTVFLTREEAEKALKERPEK